MILVTGASGFLGSHLVKRLSADGAKVRALYHHTPPNVALAALPGIEWQQCDLLDIFDVAAAFEGITHVYHCAAIVSYRRQEHERMLHFNTQSTAHVVNQALESNIAKLVHVSSIAAIGRNGESPAQVNEEEQWGETSYKTAYGISKHLAETEVWRGIGEGLNAVMVNPGIILGEGDWDRGSAALVKIAWEQFPFYTKGVTAWVDVADVVQAMLLLMASDINGERFIVSENNYSFREVMRQLAAGLQRKPAAFYAGKALTGLIWRWGALREQLGRTAAITRETAANAHSVTYYDNSRLLQALPGFQYTPLLATISRLTGAYLQAHNKNF